MTKYERARILGTRALQIRYVFSIVQAIERVPANWFSMNLLYVNVLDSMNAPVMVELEGETDPLEVWSFLLCFPHILFVKMNVSSMIVSFFILCFFLRDVSQEDTFFLMLIWNGDQVTMPFHLSLFGHITWSVRRNFLRLIIQSWWVVQGISAIWLLFTQMCLQALWMFKLELKTPQVKATKESPYYPFMHMDMYVMYSQFKNLNIFGN